MLDFMTRPRDGCRDDEIKMLFRFWMGFFLGEDLNQYVAQNHRMAGFGRDLWRLSSPISLLKQVHLE